MSWPKKLCDTYDNAISNNAVHHPVRPLPPKGFIVERVPLEITLTAEGNFVDVSELDKNQSVTLVPCTQVSAVIRGKKMEPHPIFEKIKILGQPEHMELLDNWCQFGAPLTVQAVYSYLKKGTLKKDITEPLRVKKVKWDEKQSVRFRILDGISPIDNWRRDEFIDSWTSYYESLAKTNNQSICYVTGQKVEITDRHPAALDTAKLISTTIDKNCIGRFNSDASQAITIGIDTSMKIHNMRKWLAAVQGTRLFGLEVSIWSDNGASLPDIWGDGNDYENEPIELGAMTANTINSALWGYWKKSLKELREEHKDSKATVSVLAVDKVSNGRAAVVCSQELHISEYIDNLFYWFDRCKWFTVREGHKKVFSPTPKEIYNLVYGEKIMDSTNNLKKNLAKELLASISGRKPLSHTLISQVYSKACRPMAFKPRGSWNRAAWLKAVSIFCALLRKYNIDKGDECHMIPEENETNRDVLFGRLLAVADLIERKVMAENQEKQATNAIRYMPQMRLKPGETWMNLRTRKLNPYIIKLSKQNYDEYVRLTNLINVFTTVLGDRIEEKQPLGPRFLEGYSAQLLEEI